MSEATLRTCAHSDVNRDSLPKYSTNILAHRIYIFQEAEEIKKSSGSQSHFTSLKCMLFILGEFIESAFHLSLLFQSYSIRVTELSVSFALCIITKILTFPRNTQSQNYRQLISSITKPFSVCIKLPYDSHPVWKSYVCESKGLLPFYSVCLTYFIAAFCYVTVHRHITNITDSLM